MSADAAARDVDHRRRGPRRFGARGGAGACRHERHDRRSRQRRDVGGAARDADGGGWDQRVYAISPGSAVLPAQHRRMAAAAGRAHRADRSDGRARRRRRTHRVLRLRAGRARAGVDRREPRAQCRARPGGARHARARHRRAVFARGPRLARRRCGIAARRRANDIGAADRRRRWRSFVDARTGRHPKRSACLRPVRRRGQLRDRARASRPRVAMVLARRQRAGVAAAARQAHLDRLVGAVGACRRAAGARCAANSRRASPMRAATSWAR